MKTGISELVGGKLYVKNKTPESIKAESALILVMRQFIEEQGYGTLLCRVTHYWVGDPSYDLKPDLAFHSIGVRSTGGFISRIPDIVVEFITEFDHPAIIKEKVKYYITNGSGAIWLVNAKEKTIEIRKYALPTVVLKPSDTLFEEEILPGFSFNVRSIAP